MKKEKKVEMSEPVSVRFPMEDYRVLADRARRMGLSDGLYIRTLVCPLLRGKRAA